MKFAPMVEEEIAASGGMTHKLEGSYADIPPGIAAVTATTTWLTAPGGANIVFPMMQAGDIIRRVEAVLCPAFKDASDPAFIDVKLSFGDTGSATRYLNAVQAAELGTEVITSFPGATENFIYTAPLRLVLTLTTATAGKTISDLDIGKFYIMVAIHRSLDQALIKVPPFGPGTLTTN